MSKSQTISTFRTDQTMLGYGQSHDLIEIYIILWHFGPQKPQDPLNLADSVDLRTTANMGIHRGGALQEITAYQSPA